MKVKNVEWLGFITGDNSVNKTGEKYHVGGTDLGFPTYNSVDGKMYYFFGDTFIIPETIEGEWRSNVCGYGKAEDMMKNLKIEGFITDEEGRAKVIIDGVHKDKDEMTKIPTGAIEIDGTVYMFYFSKYSWNIGNLPSMNYGGCIKSTDNCKTWQRVNDLSWVDHVDEREMGGDKGNSPERIKELIEQDINGKPSGETVDIYTHEGFYFSQIFPVDGKDGYVYIFGEGGYRTEGIKLGRVKKNTTDFENFEAYEYLVGFNGKEPIWEKGSKGLKKCCTQKEAFLLEDKCSEMTISYNNYLKKWVLTYMVFRREFNNSPHYVLARTADNLWGPYSDEVPLLSTEYDYPELVKTLFKKAKVQTLYAGFTHELLTEEDGKIFYLIISQYTPIYNSSLVRITLE